LFHIYDKSFFIQSNDDLEIWNEERDNQMYDILANFKFEFMQVALFYKFIKCSSKFYFFISEV
jgi:hypothetical protein